MAPVTDMSAFGDAMRFHLFGAQNKVVWGDLSESGEAEGRDPEVVYYGEWHGFVHQPNRIDFYKKLQDFQLECTAN